MSDAAAALTSLLRQSSIEDHDEVLKTANAALKADKSNLEAQHTRVVALLKLDRFEDALRAIAEGGDRLAGKCLLEKAYALYKTADLDGAEKVLESVSDASYRAVRHLAAQVAYRAEKFDRVAQLYRGLASDDDEHRAAGEDNDVRINTLATTAQLEWKGLGNLVDEAQKQPTREDLEAFETAFNAACGCVSRGDYSKASVLLKRARDLCEASEDLSDEEKRAELLPIVVQHAYVLARLGKEEEALALQRSIVMDEISEVPTKAVARNNHLAMGLENRNPFLMSRLLQESVTNISGNDQFFEYQNTILRRNRLAMDLRTQKFDGVERSTAKIISKTPAPTASTEIAGLGVISAAAHAHLEAGKVAIKKIVAMLEKRPTDIGLLLTIIQLYVQTQNPGPALHLLETFLKRLETATTPDHLDVRFAPGLVATTVALYRRSGRQNSIRRELANAAKHWRSVSSSSNESATSLLREAGVELLKSSNPEDFALAGATFESLASKSQNNDTMAAAGLVASFATTDYAKVEPYLQNLTPIDRLTAGTDVEALISSGVASVATNTTANTTITPTTQQGKKRPAPTATDADQQQQPAKKRRKNKLPKNYDENKQPDPERWLPLRDRSTYRPKGKKGKKRAQESHQGGAVREEETLELVGGAGAVKVEKASGSGGAGGGGGGGNKKKKKGKK